MAAARLAAAWSIVRDTPQTKVGQDGAEKDTTVTEVVDAVVQVVSRDKLEAALETIAELLPLPSAEDDGDLEWRVELMERYATVRPFLEQLAAVIPWGSTAARLADRRGGEGAAPGDRGPQARRRARHGIRGPGDGVVAEAGVRQSQARIRR